MEYTQFEKFIGAQMVEQNLCQFSVAELVDELRNRQDVELTVIEEGTKLTTTIIGPALLLQIKVNDDVKDGMEHENE
ncbi:MAG: hypothetical protein K0R18_1994 [Bacillales bacterium]|jgi:hypothetical protein|nr:hypothetical protein [Bacillales bacterium]